MHCTAAVAPQPVSPFLSLSAESTSRAGQQVESEIVASESTRQALRRAARQKVLFPVAA